MLHNEARKLLIEAWNKTHNAKEIAECFSVSTSTVYRLENYLPAGTDGAVNGGRSPFTCCPLARLGLL